MKIEIDTNNLVALQRLEGELDIALGTVRHAIQKLKQKAKNGGKRASSPAVGLRLSRHFLTL
jgi:hypothetical protein